MFTTDFLDNEWHQDWKSMSYPIPLLTQLTISSDNVTVGLFDLPAPHEIVYEVLPPRIHFSSAAMVSCEPRHSFRKVQHWFKIFLHLLQWRGKLGANARVRSRWCSMRAHARSELQWHASAVSVWHRVCLCLINWPYMRYTASQTCMIMQRKHKTRTVSAPCHLFLDLRVCLQHWTRSAQFFNFLCPAVIRFSDADESTEPSDMTLICLHMNISNRLSIYVFVCWT